MGRTSTTIEAEAAAFIAAQHVFFVASAPSGDQGHVNLSPKGRDSLRVLDSRTIAWLDLTGSGAETIAHLRQNGRIAVMWCAFEGPPRILRVHGRGRIVEPPDPGFAALRSEFPTARGARAIIVVAVAGVRTSCGTGVPLLAFQADRSELDDWAVRKGEQGLLEYQRNKNARSLDGLPALRWVEGGG